MATATMRKVRLSNALQEATAALTLLDAEALERLSARLTRIAAGLSAGAVGMDSVVEREPVEAIAARQRVLASVLAATEANLRVMEGLESRGHTSTTAKTMRAPWER